MQSLIGHIDILQAFERMVANGTLPHAVLLVGPSHVGKTTIAEWLAQRLLCDCSRRQTNGGPCGICPICAQVARGVHPDVMRIGEGGAISVEAVRAWTSAIASSSLFGGWKIGIVEGADQFTEEAANACLKTIEEPPPRTILILTAAQRRSVLPTIVSRCAMMRCRRVADAELLAGLTNSGITPADADRFTRAADGCPGLAITWAHTPGKWELQTKREQLAHDILNGPYVDRIRRVEQFVRGLPEDRAAAQAAIADLLHTFRGIARDLTARIVGGARDAGVSVRPPELIRWMNILVRAPQELAANVTPRLVLDSIVLTYP